MDRGTWQGAAWRVAKSWTRLKRLSTQSRKRSNSCYCSRLQVATWVSRIWSPGWESLSTQTQTSSSPQSLTIRRCGKTQRYPTTLGLETGWRFHSPVLSSLLFLVVVCFSFFLATCPYLLRWTTADILPAGVWWRRVSVSSAPQTGVGGWSQRDHGSRRWAGWQGGWWREVGSLYAASLGVNIVQEHSMVSRARGLALVQC